MPDMIDDQEMVEREEEVSALADEDEQHFVDFCIDSAKESRESRKDVLKTMELLWDAYLNIMAFGDKEAWQSKVITNKPFTAVERAVSIVRKAFRNPNYIDITGIEVGDKDMSFEAKRALSYWMSSQKADFPRKFSSACRMGLATGTSLELIPRWDNGFILDWDEPWKVLRDPDAITGEPWSGNYCIREEWMDMWILQEAAKNKYFINIDKVKEGGQPTSEDLSKEEIEKRKGLYWDRSQYRKSVLVRQFSGVVLGKNGSLLLPKAKYTIAGDVLIRKPEVIPFVKIRWAENSFTPVPHVLRYDGRGIIEGVFDIWKMLNNMLSLTMDDFSWVVNRMREIAPELMLDPSDLEFYPGKEIYRTMDMLQYPVVKDVLTTSNIEKILAVAQYIAQQIDNGDFVSEFVSGLPGSRSNITKGEVEIKTEQNLGIFDSIGAEIETGGVNCGYATFETIVLNWNQFSRPSPIRVLGDNEFTRFLEGASLEEKKQFLEEGCDLSITGISSQLQAAEKTKLLMAMKAFVEHPLFGKYFKPKEYIDEMVGSIGLYKAPFVKTKAELMQTEMGEQIVEALGKLVAEGGPEVQMAIKQFLDSLGLQGGMPPNVGGGEGSATAPTPPETEPPPAGT